MSLCEKCAKFYGLADENNLCSFCFDPTRAEVKLRSTKRPQDPVEIKQRIDQLALSTELFDLLKQQLLSSIDDRSREAKNDSRRLSLITNQKINQFGVDHEMENGVIFTAEQAKDLYNLSAFRIPFNDEQLEHLLCIRVIDNWNIDQEVMHVGHCYYGSYYRPSTPEDIHIPNFKQLKLHENVL
ncbi:unnamed protein product [Didymodactylos carnosus]|uniref:Uncharacterized protein n=2 Tax=Didymodactylos carnosus TaxID=1234261 RepID=A0A8S2YP85_9BILA|nr:unnamed protein product [Didymodactylos carnosus]